MTGNRDLLHTHRRGFLKLVGVSTALGALAQVRTLPAAALTAGERDGARFFSPEETEILTQVVERIVDTGEADAPRVRQTGSVAALDALCRSLDPALTRPLPLLLRAVEYAPIFLDLQFSRFTRMSEAQKDASLEAWMRSRLQLRRLGFLALRNLAMLGYYSQEETWPLLGYGGPLLPRRAGSA